MARGRAGPPDIKDLRASCAEAAQALREQWPNSEGARLMLRRLVEDLGALIRSIERAGVGVRLHSASRLIIERSCVPSSASETAGVGPR